MVVIAAGRYERGARAHPLHHLKAEHATVECKRAIEVGDLEMNVTDAGAGMDGWASRHGAAPLMHST
jgi:nitrate/nitrite-specific signal transduction histidine kinase